MVLGGLAGGILLPRPALASTSLALSMKQLVSRSDRAVVAMPVQHQSSWATVAGSRRIITETRVIQQDNWLSDETAESDELLIVTLGGRVGDIQQKIPGEASLKEGEECVLFAGAEQSMLRRVIGMGQGHYPVTQSGKVSVVRRSPRLPHLVGPKPGHSAPARDRRAVDALDQLTLADARTLVRSVR